jgi:hypothetical protein
MMIFLHKQIYVNYFYNLKPAKLYILILLLSSCSPSLHKGFEALSIYDYFKAKKIFVSKLKTKQKNILTATQAGLTVIYCRKDNPFFHLDSAIKYVRLAKLNYDLIPKDKNTLFYNTNISEKYMDSLKAIIDLQLEAKYPKVKPDSNGLEQVEDFIFKYYDHPKLSIYKDKRDTLAMSIAKTQGAKGMYNFIKSFPKSLLRKEAERLRDEFIFKSSIEENSFESFDRFIQLHQQNEYKSAAIDSLYELSFKNENIEWLARLLKEYPAKKHETKSQNLWLMQKCLDAKKNLPIKFSTTLFVNEIQEKLMRLERYSSQRFLIYPTDDEKIRFINDAGETTANTDFVEAQLPFNGLSIATQQNMFTLADINGTKVLNANLEDLEYIFPYHYIFSKNNKYGIINALGDILIEPIYEELNYSKDNNILIALKNKKFGLITCFNNNVLPFEYENISDIKHNQCIIKKNESFYLYDLTKKAFQTLNYEWLDNMHSEWIRVKRNGKYGIVNYRNESIINCDYDRIKICNDSLFLVVKNEFFGLLNQKNEVVLPIENIYEESVEKEILVTKNYKKVITALGESVVNNYNQEIVVKKLKQKVRLVNNRFAILSNNKGFQLFDLLKKQIITNYKTEPVLLSENLLFVKEKNKTLLFNLSNNKKIECSEVEKWNGLYLIKVKENFQLVQENLNDVLNKTFDIYEKINESCLKISKSNQAFIYDYSKNNFIEVKP